MELGPGIKTRWKTSRGVVKNDRVTRVTILPYASFVKLFVNHVHRSSIVRQSRDRFDERCIWY
jgi:hypothetical protein